MSHPKDPNEHVAEMFHGLIADLQRNDVACFEEDSKQERIARAALRSESGAGLNAGDLLKKLDGDPEEEKRRIEDDIARIAKEAQAAADAHKDKKDEPLPVGHYPPPPVSR